MLMDNFLQNPLRLSLATVIMPDLIINYYQIIMNNKRIRILQKKPCKKDKRSKRYNNKKIGVITSLSYVKRT